jgi:hypothetical protein
MSRPVASRRFQRSMTSSASRCSARSAFILAAPALMSSPRVRTPIPPVSRRGAGSRSCLRLLAGRQFMLAAHWRPALDSQCATKPTGSVRHWNELQDRPIEFAGDGRTRGVGRKPRLHERARSDRLHFLKRKGTDSRMPWLGLRRHGAPKPVRRQAPVALSSARAASGPHPKAAAPPAIMKPGLECTFLRS